MRSIYLRNQLIKRGIDLNFRRGIIIVFLFYLVEYSPYSPNANRMNILKRTRQVRDPASYAIKRSALRELPGKSETQRGNSRA